MKCKCGEDYSHLANIFSFSKSGPFLCKGCGRKIQVDMDECMDEDCTMIFSIEEVEYEGAYDDE